MQIKSCICWFEFHLFPPRDFKLCKGRRPAWLSPESLEGLGHDWCLLRIWRMNVVRVWNFPRELAVGWEDAVSLRVTWQGDGSRSLCQRHPVLVTVVCCKLEIRDAESSNFVLLLETDVAILVLCICIYILGLAGLLLKKKVGWDFNRYRTELLIT